MNSIEINGLTKSYGDFSLRDISFSLPQGSILGLVGENGAGKSTTIKLIMNAIARDSGDIRVLGIDNLSEEFTELKQDIGVVLDEAYFPETLTAKRLCNVMRNIYRRWDDGYFAQLLKTMALPDNKEFRHLSRGMKMKLAIAVALSHKPRLLILDEATGGLDPIVRDEILDVFSDFIQDESHSILISSHIVSDLQKVCDRIAFIHKGQLVFCEEKAKLLREYAIAKLSQSELEAMPDGVIKGIKKVGDVFEVLVLKSEMPSTAVLDHTSLEDIILLLARGGNR